MITMNIKIQFREETLYLVVFSLICVGLTIFRTIYTGSSFLLFLNWNLFLAAIPYLITSLIRQSPGIRSGKIILSFLFVAWFLFFPNAPYILTDLFHLRISKAMPIWFDLSMLLLFSWTGLMFGFLSFLEMERIIMQKNVRWNSFLSSMLLVIISFGIYVGRYLRWNSWDVLSNPEPLFYELGGIFTDPKQHPGAWGMTITMGLLLNAIYWSFKLLKRTKSIP